MLSHNRRRMAGVTLTLGILLVLSGCGSGTGSGTAGTNPTTLPSIVTRATEPQYTADGLILAARVSTGPFITTDTAAMVDADLARIRAQYPVIASIKPQETPSLHGVIVGLKQTAPWRDAWKSGTIATGDATLDQLLASFTTARVTHITDAGTADFYTLVFDGPVNTPKVAEQIAGASAEISSAEQNALVGDGNNITLKVNADNRVYSFSQGWGDCLAGCINRHYWNVTVAADGSLSLAESGSDLSTAPGAGTSTPQ